MVPALMNSHEHRSLLPPALGPDAAARPNSSGSPYLRSRHDVLPAHVMGRGEGPADSWWPGLNRGGNVGVRAGRPRPGPREGL